MKYPFQASSYAFTVCRIEPENNIHIILEAFKKDTLMPLVIVGNWMHGEYGRDLKKYYGKMAHIFLLDPIYEPEKLNEIRSQCKLYLHGHSCGGTNPSLVEAMYLGLPIAAFDVNFNRETTENQALYFDSSKTLRQLCREIKDKQLQNVASAMKEIALRRYRWDRICDCYSRLF